MNKFLWKFAGFCGSNSGNGISLYGVIGLVSWKKWYWSISIFRAIGGEKMETDERHVLDPILDVWRSPRILTVSEPLSLRAYPCQTYPRIYIDSQDQSYFLVLIPTILELMKFKLSGKSSRIDSRPGATVQIKNALSLWMGGRKSGSDRSGYL